MNTTLTRAAQVAADAVRSGETIRREWIGGALSARSDDDGAGRTVEGIGVPWGEVIEHWFGKETFDRGSVEPAPNVRILYQHREPIGRVTKIEDTDAGAFVAGPVSDTSAGRDALTLVRDGVINAWSIGFRPEEYRVEKDDDGNEIIHWTRVTAEEFSLVTFPAYSGAEVTDLRAAAHTTPRTDPTPRKDSTVENDTLTRDDLTPLEQSITDLERAIARGIPAGGASPAGRDSRWNTMGEFVRALVVDGDDDALALANDMANRAAITTGDTILDGVDGTGFLGVFIKFLEERQTIKNLFQTGTLPAEGMTVSYARFLGDSLTVGRQSAEGANLPGPGKLSFGNGSAPVLTGGGWTDLTRQAIERSNINYLDTIYTALGLRYAAWVESEVTAALNAELTALTSTGGDGVISLPASATAADWLDGIVDAGQLYKGRGFKAAGLAVGVARFKELNRLTDGDGRRLMNVYGSGVNQVGELNLPEGDGNIGRVPVRIIDGLTATDSFFYDPVAVKTLENPGSPIRLQDDNIINLTRAFSLYGYAAVTVPFPTALVPVVNASA